jgi:hypothetical protein
VTNSALTSRLNAALCPASNRNSSPTNRKGVTGKSMAID